MFDKLKELFKKDKKKTYTEQPPDLVSILYLLLAIFIALLLIIRTYNQNAGLSLFIYASIAIGILVTFIILIMLPMRAISFAITEIFLRVIHFNTPKNTPSETVVVVGKNDYFRPSFWFNPNYDTDLLLIVDYLGMLGKPFSIYHDASPGDLDKIMANKEIRTVYLIGHGRRHGFAIDSNTVVDYCKYNEPKYEKDFVYQIHCNGGRGKSLVEYVVPKENQGECLPEHGLMSNFSIDEMFIDKIIKLRGYTGNKERLERAKYTLLTRIIPLMVTFGWILIILYVVSK